MKVPFLVVAAVASALFVGCGGGASRADGGTDSGGATTSRTNFVNDVRGLICKRADLCCLMNERQLDGELCVTVGLTSFLEQAGAQAAFNADLAAKCFDVLRAWTCTDRDIQAVSRACAFAFSGAGRVAEGAACAYDVDCAQPVDASVLCIDNKCRRQPIYGDIGASCDMHIPFTCALYGSCGRDAAGTAICQAFRNANDTCTPFGPRCGPDLACSGTGVCSPPGLTGASCVDGTCEPGAVCVDRMCQPQPLSEQYFCKDS